MPQIQHLPATGHPLLPSGQRVHGRAGAPRGLLHAVDGVPLLCACGAPCPVLGVCHWPGCHLPPPQPPEVWVSPLNIDNMQILPHSPQPPPLPTPGLVRALVHLPAQEAPAPGPLHFLCLLRRTRNLLAWPFPSSSSSLGCSVPQRSLPCLGSPTLPAFSLSCLVHVLFV